MSVIVVFLRPLGLRLYKVIVIEDYDGIVRGWASINVFNSRCCYSGVGDLSIYVERNLRGKTDRSHVVL